ncbi:MAG: hypothetical protein GX885_11465 [Methanomicrobiales archaeon]|nr:hypothetical protein [Methanomicrobiales archaeon]
MKAMKTDKLKKLSACHEAIEWVATQKDYETAWQNCERGDWMLWLAKKLNVDDRKLTLAKFKCANQVRHLLKDQRSIDALDAAEKYGNGEAGIEALNTAADAAYDAAEDAPSAYASAAASADASVAAYAALATAEAAYATAAYAIAEAAYAASLKKSADFCREVLTDDVLTAYRELK